MARIPKLCHHKRTGRAYVTDPATGKEVYLGEWGSPEAQQGYAQWVQEYLKRGPSQSRPTGNTVYHLIEAYLSHADTYYLKHGKPTSEQACLELVCRHLAKVAGTLLIAAFTPSKLKEVRDCMVSQGYARESINKHVHRIRRIWRWGVEHELVSADVLHALEAVAPLAKGRCAAPESEPVRPVDIYAIEKTIVHLRKPVLVDMVRFQLLTGCRPQDVVIARLVDIDQSKTPWLYTPPTHKAEHHGAERLIWLGPKARALLAHRLLTVSTVSSSYNGWLFPVPWHKSGSSLGRYTTQSYRRAIERACKRAGVEHWTPNQLRHTAGTLIREKYGLEGAQVVLGHEEMDVTQIYAERSADLARRIAEDMG